MDGADVFLRRAGTGPAVRLLHGYPETHLAWRRMAPPLAKRFTVVAADLPGYGDSTLSGLAGTELLSTRVMARVLADVMTSLGYPGSRSSATIAAPGCRTAWRWTMRIEWPLPPSWTSFQSWTWRTG